MRLDLYLTAQSLAPSRTQAQELITGGFVRVNGREIRKVSFAVDENFPPAVEVVGKPHPYVGRGGMKLEGALQCFGIDPSGMICADIGASTGGFTDCLLQHGASRVFAVDSGSDQLDPSLRADSRVVNIEHFNARNLTTETFGCLCDMAVADLSFISQTYVLGNIASVLKPGGIYVGLIKPQFECGPSALDKRGIVRSTAEHMSAIRRVRDEAFSHSLIMHRIIESPIRGGDGNREFLCLCIHSEKREEPVSDSVILQLVRS